MRHGPRDLTLIVFTIAYHDDGAPHRMVAAVLAQLFAAGPVNGVVHSGTAAVVQTPHAGFEQPDVVGKILRDLAVTAEAHHESLIEIGPQACAAEN